MQIFDLLFAMNFHDFFLRDPQQMYSASTVELYRLSQTQGYTFSTLDRVLKLSENIWGICGL